MTDNDENGTEGATEAGRRLWKAITTSFVLEEHELSLLREAVRTKDLTEALQSVVDEDGPVVGGRAPPAVVELRQERLVLARLLVALRIPIGEGEGQHRLQRRGIRGSYGVRGVVA